jgi:LicD family
MRLSTRSLLCGVVVCIVLCIVCMICLVVFEQGEDDTNSILHRLAALAGPGGGWRKFIRGKFNPSSSANGNPLNSLLFVQDTRASISSGAFVGKLSLYIDEYGVARYRPVSAPDSDPVSLAAESESQDIALLRTAVSIAAILRSDIIHHAATCVDDGPSILQPNKSWSTSGFHPDALSRSWQEVAARYNFATLEARGIQTTSDVSGDRPRHHSVSELNGQHTNCRYDYKFPLITLHRSVASLLDAWFRYAELHKIEYWIAHGTLLGWWFGRHIQAWDIDNDIQMSWYQLSTLYELFQTEHGHFYQYFEGRYRLDITPSFKWRHIQEEPYDNFIDAAFYDMTTGAKMDITSFSPVYHTIPRTPLPQAEQLKSEPVTPFTNIGARDAFNGHVYNLSDIYPLRKTCFNGYTTWIPARYEKLLKREYGVSVLYSRIFQYLDDWYHFDENHGEWRRGREVGQELQPPLVNLDYEGHNHTQPGCRVLFSLPERAWQYPSRRAWWIPPETISILRQNPFKLLPEQLESLIEPFLEWNDIDNDIASSDAVLADSNVRVVYFNAQRAANLCQQTEFILANPQLRDADIWILNEFDIGCARSNNWNTVRMLASALGFNYAWGIEFLELTQGNHAEQAAMAPSDMACPKRWRSPLFHGREDSWSLHGNAVLSRFPLRDIRTVRHTFIPELYNSHAKQWYTDAGAEKRLGTRMTLFATADVQTADGLTIPVHVGAVHCQSVSAAPELEKCVEPTISAHAEETKRRDPLGNDLFVMGGDCWLKHWYNDLGFSDLGRVQPDKLADWIAARNHKSFQGTTMIDSGITSDHNYFLVSLEI